MSVCRPHPPSSIVGYQTHNVAKGGTYAFGVQFQTVDGNSQINVKDLLTVAAPVGSTAASASDQIWFYNAANGWSKYFYYVRGATKQWRKQGESAETTGVVSNGASFFFVRSGSTASSDTSITLAGAVRPLTTIAPFAVAKGETVMMANPWPVGFSITSFNNFNKGTPVGGTAASSSDQIWRYDASNGWRKYFYYVRGATKQWRKQGESAETTDEPIAPGEGFFFVRSGSTASSDTTIQFNGPEVK